MRRNMAEKLSFFNWSLKKLLFTEPSSFGRARIRILFTILVFALAKVAIVIPIAAHHNQTTQLVRAIFILTTGIILLKFLLANKNHTRTIAQIVIWIGLLLIWSNIFVYAQTLNIVTLQFIFIIILSSFYLLGTRSGLIYSGLANLPVIIYLITGRTFTIDSFHTAQLASPGYTFLVVLNMVTFVIAHYLYHKAFNSNVEEKENLNNQLKLAVEDANRASESKSDFLSTMSHELRTPLNSVIGMTQLLLESPHNEEQAENLKILNFSAVNLHSLINDILDFNKLGADKLELETIRVDLYTLMNDICSGLRFQANEKALDLVLDIDEVIKGEHIITDPTRITQIIYNLAGNAIKFTSKGNVAVTLKVNTIDFESINIRFSIADTGIGIDPEKQQAIFEPFTQASTSTTRNFGGTGLGLAIVKRLLVLLNSSINLKSTPGTGSDFFFDISFKRDKKAPAIDETIAERTYDLSGLRILVAEDNAMNRLLLKKVLSQWKNKPDFAVNGEEALEKLANETYDLILMDIHMPVMDGYNATKAIRSLSDETKARIPVIALTASVSNNLNDKIKAAGMNDYIYKPFNSKELYNKLKRIVLTASDNISITK